MKYIKPKELLQFEEDRKELTAREIQLEILYSNWKLQNRMERNRSNTSKLVWIIVLNILFSFAAILFLLS